MVFNVSGNVQDPSKVDAEKSLGDGWEVSSVTSSKGLVSEKTPVAKKRGCCSVLPWFLLFISLIMLGCVSSWGWKEHKKLQAYLDCEKKRQESFRDSFLGNHPFPPLNMDQTRFPMYIDQEYDNRNGDEEHPHGDHRIPYGNDALVGPDQQGKEDHVSDNTEVADGDEKQPMEDDPQQNEPRVFRFQFLRFRFPDSDKPEGNPSSFLDFIRNHITFRSEPTVDPESETEVHPESETGSGSEE